MRKKKNQQGSEHQAQAIVPKCPLSAQCMMCLSVVLQIFLCLRSWAEVEAIPCGYYLGPAISLVKICIVNFGKWFRILQIWANDKISDDCPNISLSGDENINPDLLWFWCWTVDTRGVPGPSSRPMDLCHTPHLLSHTSINILSWELDCGVFGNIAPISLHLLHNW